MRRASIALLVAGSCFVASSASLSAQEAPRTEEQQRRPAFSGTVGVGNALGWPGASLEYYFLHGHLSAAVGAGYLPEALFTGRPGSGAYSARIRGYLGSLRHRAALELSMSLVYFEWITVGDVLLASRDDYGPGLSVAYRYTSEGGFHADVSLGAGWAGEDGLALGLGLPSSRGRRPLTPILSIGIGYTMLR